VDLASTVFSGGVVNVGGRFTCNSVTVKIKLLKTSGGTSPPGKKKGGEKKQKEEKRKGIGALGLGSVVYA
jgi:hypothetical protein